MISLALIVSVFVAIDRGFVSENAELQARDCCEMEMMVTSDPVVNSSSPGASDTAAVADEPETARSASPEPVSVSARSQVETLASLGLLRRRQLNRNVMFNLAILRAHHLRLPREDIRRQSGLKKSKMYEVVQEAQRFVEKLRRDARLERLAASFRDGHEHFVLSCELCDGDFESNAGQRVDTYPAMHHHWREQHDWSPRNDKSQKGETPVPSAQWLTTLGSEPPPDLDLDSEPRSDARRLVEDWISTQDTFSEAFDGATGEALSGALESISHREDAMLRAQNQSAREQYDRSTALQDVTRHAFEAEYLRLGCNIEIAEALNLQVSAATLARITGFAATTVARRGSQVTAHLEALAQLLGLTWDSSDGADNSPVSAAIYRMLRSESDRTGGLLRELTHGDSGESVLNCLKCPFSVTTDSSRSELLHHIVRVHWRIAHALFPDPACVDVENVQYYRQTLLSVFGDDGSLSDKLWASAHSSLHFAAQERIENRLRKVENHWTGTAMAKEAELALIESEQSVLDEVFADPRTHPLRESDFLLL